MKICLFSSVYALSESDKHAAFLVECNQHLLDQGHEIHVLAPSFRGLGSHVVKGVKVHRFRYFFERWEHLTHGEGAPNRIRNPLYLALAGIYVLMGAIAAVRLCQKEKFDLIHVHWPFPHAIWGWCVQLFYKTPMVLIFHGAELLLSKRFPFVNPVLKFFIKRSSGLSCNSNYTAAQLKRLTGQDINIIPYGASIEVKAVKEKKENSELTVNELNKRVLFVGRLIERKGIPYLIEAMQAVIAASDLTNVVLDIVGSGPEKLPAEALVKDLGLQNNVVFHDVVSDEKLCELYQSASVFVLPAIVDSKGDTEGLGVVLVEAMSFMVPVIASRVGGITDVVIDDETGLLVPEKNIAALSAAIKRMLTHPDLGTRLSSQAMKHVKSYFDWDRIVNELVALSQKATMDIKNQPN